MNYKLRIASRHFYPLSAVALAKTSLSVIPVLDPESSGGKYRNPLVIDSGTNPGMTKKKILLQCRSMKTSPRGQRLAGSIQQMFPEILRPQLDPDVHGFVTITAVEVSGDLGVVDVFVRSLGGPADYLKALQKMEKKVAHQLLQKLSLRRHFILRFKPDQAVKAVEALDKIDL